MSELLFAPIFGVPLVLWLIIAIPIVYPIFYMLVWGVLFPKYIWDRDYMREILGDEFMRLHG